MSDYPEHDKLKAISEESQTIGAFLDNSEYHICEYDERHGRFFPAPKSITQILADYFDIDLNKIEEEKRQMLESLRS